MQKTLCGVIGGLAAAYISGCSTPQPFTTAQRNESRAAEALNQILDRQKERLVDVRPLPQYEKGVTRSTLGNTELIRYPIAHADPEEYLRQMEAVLTGEAYNHIFLDTNANTLVVGVNKSYELSNVLAEETINYLQKADIRPAQFQIEVYILQIRTDEAYERGADIGVSADVGNSVITGDVISQGTTASLAESLLSLGRIGVVGDFSSIDLQAILQSSYNVGGITSIVNTTLTTIQDREVQFQDNAQIAISEQNTNNEVTTFTAKFEDVKTGATFKVSPRGNGEMMLTYQASVGTVDATDVSAPAPTIISREANGTVQVTNGTAIVLAMFQLDEQQKTENSTPPLSFTPVKGEYIDSSKTTLMFLGFPRYHSTLFAKEHEQQLLQPPKTILQD